MRDEGVWHVTLTTGNRRWSRRAEVDERVVRWLQPVARPGQWEAADLGLRVRVAADPELPGAVAFDLQAQVGRPSRWAPVLYAVGCADPAAHDRAVDLAAEAARTTGSPVVDDWQDLLAVPWLAVLLLPPAALVRGRTLQVLGDLERCVWWALRDAGVLRAAPGGDR